MIPEIYVYFNRQEINQLYAQIMGWVPTERTKNNSRTIEGGLSAGIPVVSAKASGAKESGTKERYEISEERKLYEIKDHLRNNHQLIDDISEAVAYVLNKSVSIFIQSRHRFDVPQFRDGSDPVKDVNESNNVLLECDIGSTRILVSMGLEHMPRVRGNPMSKTGHDAIMFREFHGKEVPLEIFGFLHHVGSRIQIRPITVSL